MKSFFMVYVIFLFVSFSVMETSNAVRLAKEDNGAIHVNNEKNVLLSSVIPCPKSRIQITQGPQGTVGGIPQYRLIITNLCESSCNNVHVSCGEFASARFINPTIFKRLSVNDCLVNNGATIKPGQVISFTYATTFQYPMAVTSATCH